MVEPSLVLYGAPYERAVEVLEETLRETGARYALLIDRQGSVLAHKEALWPPKPPPPDTPAPLVASNHQGERMGLYVDEAGEHALPVLVFDETAPLGKVKLHGKRAAEALARIAEEALANPPRLALDTEYREGAEALLDDLLRN